MDYVALYASNADSDFPYSKQSASNVGGAKGRPKRKSSDAEACASVGLAEHGKLRVLIRTFEQTRTSRATVRIVSTREATRRERENYEETPR